VAVLDFDPDSGELSSGVRFRPASECRRYREYEIADEEDVHAADFIAVNAFGTVLRTMYMFEEDDTLLAIDKAKNNTSIVFLLEWRGWKLLFTGDAEKKSWQMMNKYRQLEEVHFLKTSHHGSHTGMPPAKLLDNILPGKRSQRASDGKRRHAVVSTYKGTYSGVPDQKTLRELRKRCRVHSTEELKDGDYFEFSIEGWGKRVTVRRVRKR